MPPQKILTSGKNSTPRASGRASAARSLRDSATSGAIPIEPSPLRLKLNLPRASSQNPQGAIRAPSFALDLDGEGQADEQLEEDDDLPVMQREARTTRTGRVIKSTKHQDFAYGSDAFIPSSVGKADDEEYDAAYQGRGGSSPLILQKQQQPKRKPGRPFKNRAIATKPTLSPVLEDSWPDGPSFYPLAGDLPIPNDAFEQRVDGVIGKLGSGPRVFVELPAVAPDDGDDEAYTPELLMSVYLRAHKEARWHVCDLVADTWIRAFHAKRLRQERTQKFDNMCWRFNESLYNRREEGRQGFDLNAPNYSCVLEEDDPLLAKDALDFNPELLGRLYTHTEGHCAARNLWADAMALCGSKLENRMQSDKRKGVQWNEKLIYDIMCTTLRMTRRKLTLKIEEATEGAWCKRYHMHALYGKPCYRKIAYDRKVAGLDSSDEDESEEEEPMTLVMETGFSMPGMLNAGGMYGGDTVMGKGVDEDAEGESDYEYAG